MFDRFISMIRPIQFKGKARLLGWQVPRSGLRNACVFGYRMELDLIDHIQRMVYLGAYERWETRMVSRMLQPGMCFVDIGANIGYFSLLAARHVGPEGHVFAIEPSPYAADILSRVISTNAISCIRLEQCGLGRSRSEVVLYDAPIGNHTPSMLGDLGRPGRVVPVHTLDDLVREWGIDRIDLLKIDVEGYEPEVFAGASRTLAEGRVRAILCEFNAHWLSRAGTSSREVHQGLMDLGFVDTRGDSGNLEASSLENRLLVWKGRTR